MDEAFDSDDEIPFRASYDPDSDAWSADLLFWRPSRLSDEKMQVHFYEWDGRWSEQTKRALQRLKAKGLDLNENWALCAPYWSCPGCRRSKDEIFRLSKRGILLAKLELHHDHLRDRIWHRARELFGPNLLEALPKSSIIILDYIRELTSRFDYCLLCSECNAADGQVKARFRADIDSRFSFTPNEIGVFIRARASQDHEIDYEKALSLWQSEKDNFLARLTLIDELLTHLVRGRLARDRQGMSGARGVNGAFDASSLLVRAFYWETKDTERAGLLWGFRDEFLARSTQRDSAKLPPATNRSKLVIAPTDEEYAAYVDPVSPKSWQALASEWACPVCERSKRQILRKSKNGKWTGGIRSHSECDLEQDPRIIANRRRLFPDFRNDIFLKDITPISLCSDCAGIGASLTQRDQSIRDPYLSVADRRACITFVQPNNAHVIDFDVAAERALANDSYSPAREALYAFRARVGDFAGRFDRGRRWGAGEQDLLREFAEDIRLFHRIDGAAECMNLAKWLLTQTRRSGEGSG